MKKSTLIVAGCILFTSCGSKQGSNSVDVQQENVAVVSEQEAPLVDAISTSTTYEYKVIKKEESSIPLPDNQELKKMTYTVEIPIEYSDIALNEIADVIKRGEKANYVFVEYYLVSQPKSGPNYGISKRTPSENSTTINYVASPAPPAPEVKAPYDGCKVYGKWNMMGATVIAYQKDGRCYMVNFYGGSRYGDPELYYKTSYRGRTAFKNAEDFADVYVINGNGDLDGYYGGDLAGTFSKVN